MAEISNLHRHHQPRPSRRPISITIGSHQEQPVQPEEEFYDLPDHFAYDFDSSPLVNNSSNPSFFDDYATSFDFGFDLNAESENPGCEYVDPNCFFFGDEENDEQMNFVTDLFGTHQLDVPEDPLWDMDTCRAGESATEFGFGPGLGSRMGLRAVGLDSESDSEEFEVNSAFVNNDDDNYDGFGVVNNTYQASENEREDFEWEEVSERIQFDERENMNSLIHRIEEISVSSDISSSDGENSSLGDDESADAERNLEWEVLLAMNNLERTFEEENNGSGSEVPRVNLPEDYILTMEYDALFGQLVENENASKGSPPAAKSVVENLPSIVFTKEEVGKNNNAVCAVCKDEFAVGEKLTGMPCCHLYHGDCILPWLSRRNTCPVCRYELPTDNADYEKRRNERASSRTTTHLVDDFQVRYNFELLP